MRDGEAACPLCGARESKFWAEGADKKFGGPGRFRYVRCGRCRLVFLHPRLPADRLGEYYPDHVTPVPRPDEGSRLHRMRQWLKRAVAEEWYGYAGRIAPVRSLPVRLMRKVIGAPLRPLLGQLPPYRAKGRVLDIGCGSGGYLAFLAELGWHCTGIETGAKSRDYARSVLGLDVREGPIEACTFSDAHFDVVTLWHVIEHLPDPAMTLREIRRILKPGGLLLVRTPNVESWEAVLFRGNWYGLDPPRHLYLFSPETLSRLLTDSGFVVTRMRHNQHVVDCSRSVLYALRDRPSAGPAKIAARLLPMMEWTLWLLSPLRRLMGRGGAVHVEAVG